MSFKRLDEHVGIGVDRHFKTTLFRSERMLLGVNCLEPGQEQAVHVHADQDKAYVVEAGVGVFTVGEERSEVGRGAVVWAPAGVPHGVANAGNDRLVLIVAIAPAPGQ